MSNDQPRIQLQPTDFEIWESLQVLASNVAIDKWALVGGQMVRLHAAREGVEWPRVTTDGDIAVDIRLFTRSAMREVARNLVANGFEVHPSADGVSRFQRGHTLIDLLAPEGTGTRRVETIHGGHAVQAPGLTQALQRAITIEVSYLAETVTLRIPSLIGAVIAKAAACTEIPSLSKEDRFRHQLDFAFLLGLLGNYDVLEIAKELTPKDQRRLSQAALQILDEENHPALRMVKVEEDFAAILDKLLS
jgi:hypothetical protein